MLIITRLRPRKAMSLAVAIHAQTLNPPSQLRPEIALFMESDPTSVLAESDAGLSGIAVDPYLVFTVPQTGNYYLRVMAQDHPVGVHLTITTLWSFIVKVIPALMQLIPPLT